METGGSAALTPEEYLQKTSLSAMLTALLEETCKEKPDALRPFMLSFMLKTYPHSVDGELRSKVEDMLSSSPWKPCTDVAPTHEGLTSYLDQIKARPTLESILERALREQPSNVVGFVINCLLDTGASASGDGAAAAAAGAVLDAAAEREVAGADEKVEAAFESVTEGDADALREALEGGLDVNCRDDEANTLLHIAAEGEPGIIDLLLEHKIQLDAVNRMGRTALMQSVSYEDFDIVKRLLDSGASTDPTDVDGKNAAALAEDCCDEDIQRALGVEVREAAPEREVSLQPRRNSVSSEVVDPKAKIDMSKITMHEKDDAARARIRECVKDSILFKAADEETLKILVSAMAETKVAAGTQVIKQGDDGDFFYVVDNGHFDCFVKAEGFDAPGKKVLDYTTGGTFGELALMYNTPRAATVVATEDSLLWALDRTAFRTLLLQKMCEKRLKFEALLEGVPLLKKMQAYDRSMLSDAFEEESFGAGQPIVTQGEPGDRFYLVSQGSVAVKINGEKVKDLEQGDYFGELALLRKQLRSATVEGGENCKCVYLTRGVFVTLMKSVTSTLESNAQSYKNADAAPDSRHP